MDLHKVYLVVLLLKFGLVVLMIRTGGLYSRLNLAHAILCPSKIIKNPKVPHRPTSSPDRGHRGS